MANIFNCASTRKVTGFLFVNGKCKNFGGKVESVFHTVPMMYVQIYVQDSIINFPTIKIIRNCLTQFTNTYRKYLFQFKDLNT